ncbi:DUF4160 domain-containing protein [Kaistia dalseonensis]|uniref:DUF4160 domain-containing protein n=1 Tax=Kaistia dalseonensis TaxID=410840 RepID=A0ABU0H3N4_9HYPH|nr:DUF4160 domain-containing protein [Kaistia dalseonensis]MCX5494330.1 DUF4160 domain-containing protein [Kaistia dalseonensis]MDQ0436911.1 hypothetical protein [Kaistia dalseonensis]
MPTIAIVDGVRIVLYPKDHLPPHLHAIFAGFEAQISIATGDTLQGSLPRDKAKSIRAWLLAHQGEVAHIWEELRAGRFGGGMIE